MSFTNGKIFLDPKVNAICDKLIYFLNEEFKTTNYLNDNFGLTGKAAFILQESGIGNANNVIFITNRQDIYNFLFDNIYNFLKPNLYIKFKERLLLDFEFVKLEIWLTDSNLTFITLNEVKIQERDKIPSILL